MPEPAWHTADGYIIAAKRHKANLFSGWELRLTPPIELSGLFRGQRTQRLAPMGRFCRQRGTAMVIRKAMTHLVESPAQIRAPRGLVAKKVGTD